MPALARIAILAGPAVGAQAIRIDAAAPSAKPNPMQIENRKSGAVGWLPTAAAAEQSRATPLR